jgi:D-alanyl-lipoteichoic acid acyltransferase DltB (MBOAT superfamily)
MLFNSYEYIFFFLPITFFIYFFLLNKRIITGAKGFLVFASLFFYSWWNPIYLPIILISMLFNYTVGNILNKDASHAKISKKNILLFGILSNIALLGYFKYADFFIENVNYLWNENIGLYNLALPLGISFFTFQQISYLVDSYRGETDEYDFLNYALFVTFFPQLIAGPIVHHKEMMPQFASKWNLVKNYKNIAIGIFIFSIGLFKKVVIADNFAIWATNGFDKAEHLNMIEAWATSLSYTFQLYFDFSGYTDMAIGAALLFNIKLPINFNSPYKAKDIQDFWRRWHITLSHFLRDYIYIPLGGSRVSEPRVYANLLITFLLGGLWHGAGWTFVFWGFLHGMALVIHRIWKKLNFTMHTILAWFITFNFINISWIFFRAKNFDDALKVLNSMFFAPFMLPDKYADKLSILHELGINFGYVFEDIEGKNKTFTFILAAFIVILYFKNSTERANDFKPNTLYLSITLILLFTALSMMSNVSEFLYFNF